MQDYGVTPPPKLQLGDRLGFGKENCHPLGASSSPSRRGVLGTPLGVLTPKKVSPRPSVDDPKLEQPKVKNTFFHYGSPLRTIDIQSPPRTCPINFAPDAPWEEVGWPHLTQSPLTPLRDATLGLAPTPSTAGGGCSRAPGGPVSYFNPNMATDVAKAILAGGALRQPPHPPVGTLPQPAPVAPTGTLLRLSDFLPSPGSSAALPALGTEVHSAQALPAAKTEMAHQLESIFAAWPGFDMCASSIMPAVPPMPVPTPDFSSLLGTAGSTGQAMDASAAPWFPCGEAASLFCGNGSQTQQLQTAVAADQSYFAPSTFMQDSTRASSFFNYNETSPSLDAMTAAATAAAVAAVTSGAATTPSSVAAVAAAAVQQHQQLHQQQQQQLQQQHLQQQNLQAVLQQQNLQPNLQQVPPSIQPPQPQQPPLLPQAQELQMQPPPPPVWTPDHREHQPQQPLAHPSPHRLQLEEQLLQWQPQDQEPPPPERQAPSPQPSPSPERAAARGTFAEEFSQRLEAARLEDAEPCSQELEAEQEEPSSAPRRRSSAGKSRRRRGGHGPGKSHAAAGE